ncbi:hypothetical protein FGO68_gene17547 [Halteria grandinella]|uniref:Uncharacterized protein n=1 Tax=Halteria grandinella TaxID=5974 RepID=A0A8J8NYC5_HALGN|nr:hypothetical protein FGO68_gene17547 [Halteria grandinella]
MFQQEWYTAHQGYQMRVSEQSVLNALQFQQRKQLTMNQTFLKHPLSGEGHFVESVLMNQHILSPNSKNMNRTINNQSKKGNDFHQSLNDNLIISSQKTNEQPPRLKTQKVHPSLLNAAESPETRNPTQAITLNHDSIQSEQKYYRKPPEKKEGLAQGVVKLQEESSKVEENTVTLRVKEQETIQTQVKGRKTILFEKAKESKIATLKEQPRASMPLKESVVSIVVQDLENLNKQEDAQIILGGKDLKRSSVPQFKQQSSPDHTVFNQDLMAVTKLPKQADYQKSISKNKSTFHDISSGDQTGKRSSQISQISFAKTSIQKSSIIRVGSENHTPRGLQLKPAIVSINMLKNETLGIGGRKSQNRTMINHTTTSIPAKHGLNLLSPINDERRKLKSTVLSPQSSMMNTTRFKLGGPLVGDLLTNFTDSSFIPHQTQATKRIPLSLAPRQNVSIIEDAANEESSGALLHPDQLVKVSYHSIRKIMKGKSLLKILIKKINDHSTTKELMSPQFSQSPRIAKEVTSEEIKS